MYYYKEILDVEDYLRDPYADCTYVRICGGLLRLRKIHTLNNYRKLYKFKTLSTLDLTKIANYNTNNKKLDLMVSINCRRDGNIIHLQNKIKYLENLTPEEIEKINAIKFVQNCKEEACLAIKEKLFKIINNMNRLTAGGNDNDDGGSIKSIDTDTLAKKLRDPDEILKQLDKFEKEHLRICKEWKQSQNKIDKSVQTDFICKCEKYDKVKYLSPGGDYIYPVESNGKEICYPTDDPVTLFKNYDYHYAEYNDDDNYSLNCEALSSGLTNNSHMLKYHLIDNYNHRHVYPEPKFKRYRKKYQSVLPRRRHKSPAISAKRISSTVYNRSKSFPKPQLYYADSNYYPENQLSVTTLYFNDTLSAASSIYPEYNTNFNPLDSESDHSDYYSEFYSDTSTYSGFYTQKHLKDYYEDIDYDYDYYQDKDFRIINAVFNDY